jgi:hypothetical protein
MGKCDANCDTKCDAKPDGKLIKHRIINALRFRFECLPLRQIAKTAPITVPSHSACNARGHRCAVRPIWTRYRTAGAAACIAKDELLGSQNGGRKEFLSDI